jgi:Putative S-adenosyl-L-methionine-dependent methyltransferase
MCHILGWSEDKGCQNWISRGKDKFKFPGGGTQFIHGADKYLDQISEVYYSVILSLYLLLE